jgi:hypothetical protein
MPDAGSRLLELCNVVLDLLSRDPTISYGQVGSYFWLDMDSYTDYDYNRILSQDDYDFYDDVLAYIGTVFGNYESETDILRSLLSIRSADIDVQVGQWALDEWFYFYLNISRMFNSLDLDLVNLQNLYGLPNGRCFWIEEEDEWYWDPEDEP